LRQICMPAKAYLEKMQSAIRVVSPIPEQVDFFFFKEIIETWAKLHS